MPPLLVAGGTVLAPALRPSSGAVAVSLFCEPRPQQVLRRGPTKSAEPVDTRGRCQPCEQSGAVPGMWPLARVGPGRGGTGAAAAASAWG